MLIRSHIYLGPKNVGLIRSIREKTLSEIETKKLSRTGLDGFSSTIAPVHVSLKDMDLSDFSKAILDIHRIDMGNMQTLNNRRSHVQFEIMRKNVEFIAAKYGHEISLELVQGYNRETGKSGLAPVLLPKNIDLLNTDTMDVIVNGNKEVTFELVKKTDSPAILAKEGRAALLIDQMKVNGPETPKPKIEIPSKLQCIYPDVSVGYHGIGIGVAYVPTKPDIAHLEPIKIHSVEILLEEIRETHRAFNGIIANIQASQKANGLGDELNGSLGAIVMVLKESSVEVQREIEANWEKGADFLSAMRKVVLPQIQLIQNRKSAVGPAAENDKFATLGDDLHRCYEDVILAKYRMLPDLMAGVDSHEAVGKGGKVILICHSIAPHEAASLDNEKVAGFIEEKGSKISHASIAAEGLEIPNVFAFNKATSTIQNGDVVIIDGPHRKVIVNPESSVIEEYKMQLKKFEGFKTKIRNKYCDKKTETLDQPPVPVGIFGNARGLRDIERINKHGVEEGVGLIRTEDFFSTMKVDGLTINRESVPSFNEQVKFYSDVISSMKGKKVVFRTFDVVGGDADKALPYLKTPPERGEQFNGINICLDRVNFRPYHEIFKEQIKALMVSALVAEEKGIEFVIEFPFVLNGKVLEAAMSEIANAKREMTKDKIKFSDKVKIGSMVECKPAVEDIDRIAVKADYISIGTNDLVASIKGSDRYSSIGSREELDPDVVSAIGMVAAVGAKHNKPVIVCGGMAADYVSIPVLLGLGIRSLSIEAGPMPFIKAMIDHIDIEECKKIVKALEGITTSQEARKYVADTIEDRMRFGKWKGLKEIWSELEPIIREAQSRK